MDYYQTQLISLAISNELTAYLIRNSTRKLSLNAQKHRKLTPISHLSLGRVKNSDHG